MNTKMTQAERQVREQNAAMLEALAHAVRNGQTPVVSISYEAQRPTVQAAVR